MVDNPAMISMGILAIWAAIWSVPGIVRARRFGYRRLVYVGSVSLAVIVVMAVILILVGIFGR